MPTALPRSAAFVLLAAAVGLCGCLTPRVRPAPSQAVIEARAHRGQAAADCAALTSPMRVGFGFGEATINELAIPAVDQAARALACHTDAGAVIVGTADGHGTDADQRALAEARTQAVVQALTARGVAAPRLSTQTQGAAPAGDDRHLVILAEGRRW